MKRKAVTLLTIVLILTIVVFLGVRKMESNLAGLVDLPINSIDLNSVPNGVYKGSYTVLPISVQAEVTVTNYQITKITILRHLNGEGALA